MTTVRQPKKIITKSIKVTKSKKNENCVINIVGNKLWVLAKEQPEKLDDTLTISELKKPLHIEWYTDKNSLIKNLLSDFNLLKNGTFGDPNGKCHAGWEIDATEPASAQVDLSPEWHLKDGHTAFLFAPKEAERPSFTAKHKIPTIGDGAVEYSFSGFFATHRAGGNINISFYDKADTKLGEKNIIIPFNPEYGGGQSLISYKNIESTFIPVNETQYMRFSIKLGKQEDFNEPHVCLFFTDLSLGIKDDSNTDQLIPYSSSIDILTSSLFEQRYHSFGNVNLPPLDKNDLISVEYLNNTYEINLKYAKELRSKRSWIYEKNAQKFVEKKQLNNAIKQLNIALVSTSSEEEIIKFNNLISLIKDMKKKQSPTDLEIESIDLSGLFDEDYYRKKNHDLIGNDINLIEHFTLFGWKEGRDPNQYFSSKWYSNRYSVPHSINPLVHYITSGWKQLLDTSKDFNTQKYFETYKHEIKGYNEPLSYFLKVGIKKGHQAFGVDFKNGAVKLAKLNSHCPVPDDLNLYARYKEKPTEKPLSLIFNSKKLNIHWIVPDFSAGSGGHMTIFRMINYLERFGHRNTIWITGHHLNKTTEEAYHTIVKNFQFVSAEVKFYSSAFNRVEADAVIATGWNTVWGALGNSKIKRAFYFVQDYEPMFYATGAKAIVAEETYKQDIDCICASPWLAQIMTDKYHRWAKSFLLSYDTKSYYSNCRDKPCTSKIEIAVYYRPFTDRRAVELVLMGLEQLAKQLDNFRIHFFGNHDPLTFDAPFEYIDHGLLTADELGELYRACNVGVTFSATNYSLIPQEMMACGLPVVELDTECCQIVFPAKTITLTKPHPKSIAENIIHLLNNKEQTKEQIQAAEQWIKTFSWETAAKTVETSIIERLTHLGFKAEKKSVIKNKKPEVSIVIPTYNAGELFKKILAKVLAQQTPWQFEIIVIDSSSTDGTAEFLQSQPNIIVHTIPKSEFQHGKTRNLGAQLAQGDFIAFLTQDSMPTNDNWLYYLIASLKKYPKAAGVFGKHLPYSNASPFVKRDLKEHFNGFNEHSFCVSRSLDIEKYNQGDQGWHQFLRFYSDNNSAMRKNIWESIPYPEIEFGEDQAWAKSIIDAGYEKVYSPHGSVYHSHNYDYKEQFIRGYEEYTFFKEEFGLVQDSVNAEVLISEINALNQRDILYANSHEVTISEEELKHQLLLNKGFVLGKHAVCLVNAYGDLEDKLKLLERILKNAE